MTVRFTLLVLLILGCGILASAQVAAPEFTAMRVEQTGTDVRFSDGVKVRLVGTIEIEADRAAVENARPGDIRLEGNVVARVLPGRP
jgi:hypothetical protein